MSQPSIRDRVPARDLILYALDDLEPLPPEETSQRRYFALRRAIDNLRAAVKQLEAERKP